MSNSDIQNNGYKYMENSELIISVQENERQRIARDLHDATLQSLTHAIHQLELCDLYMEQDITKAKLELLSTKQNLKTVIQEIRNIIFDLRPMSFDDFGLKEAYESFFDTLRKYSSFEFDVIVDDIINLSEYFLLSVYRIGRECVMNAVRHSQGSKIIFRCLKKSESIYLCIQDNGIGFLTEIAFEKKEHYGFKVINERVKILNGTICVENNHGTKIVIELPLIPINNS